MQAIPVILPHLHSVEFSDKIDPVTLTMVVHFNSVEDALKYENYLEGRISDPDNYIDVKFYEDR